MRHSSISNYSGKWIQCPDLYPNPPIICSWTSHWWPWIRSSWWLHYYHNHQSEQIFSALLLFPLLIDIFIEKSSTCYSHKYMRSASPRPLASYNNPSQGAQGRPTPEAESGSISIVHILRTAFRSCRSNPRYTQIDIGADAKSPHGLLTTDTTYQNSFASSGTGGIGRIFYSGVSGPSSYL